MADVASEPGSIGRGSGPGGHAPLGSKRSPVGSPQGQGLAIGTEAHGTATAGLFPAGFLTCDDRRGDGSRDGSGDGSNGGGGLPRRLLRTT
jgi:hypothetical protein